MVHKTVVPIMIEMKAPMAEQHQQPLQQNIDYDGKIKISESLLEDILTEKTTNALHILPIQDSKIGKSTILPA